MKNKIIVFGLTFVTLGLLILSTSTTKTSDLYESVESDYNLVNGINLRETKIGTSNEISVSETYSQWGKNEETGRTVLRFATAISGEIKSAEYVRGAIDGKEENIKEVTTVYAGIQDKNGVAYYTDGGLVYEKPEVISHYWAVYTIEFNEDSKYKGFDISMSFNVTSDNDTKISKTKTSSLHGLLAESGDYYLLPARTNSETIANPDVWGFNAKSDAKFDIKPCYELGKLYYALSDNNSTSEGDNQLRFQPNLPVGTEYIVKAKVSYEGNGYFLYGNDYKNSKHLTVDANGYYNIEWNGTVSSKNPFYFTFRSNDNFATKLKLVVHEFEYEAVISDEGLSYDLQKKTNSEVCASPDIWAYTAPTGAIFAETPRIENDVITFALGANNVSGDYQLRYQPKLDVGTAYKVSAKVKFEGKGYFLYSQEYKNSKDLVADENGVYSISWTGLVKDKPFIFAIKSNDNFASALKIIISEFSYQAI